ncbi:hypothetical protein HK405_000806 [Cladochytrium tenue]|nr:hypothetical protein HK405_000806 [Cladochytrium tenue]
MAPIVPPSPHRLYVGNLAASLDLPLLRELRITHVVQVLEEDWSPHAAAGIAYLPIVVEDSPTVDLAQHFRRSIRFAASAWGCCDCRGCLGLSDASAAAVTADAGSHGCAYCNNVADDNGIHGDDVLDKGNDGVVNDDDDDKGDDDDDTSAGVLVHCQMGSSRSGAVAAALLMWLLRLPASAAVDTVRAARPCVNPNDGFLCQLANFEVALGLRVAHEAAA